MNEPVQADEKTTPQGTPPDADVVGPAFRQLCEVVAKLRSADGCPWDRVQTLESIKPYTLAETYELLEAIDSGNDEAIVEELGDLLLQVILDAQIGADEGRFELADVIERITSKMIERHPHVFGDAVADSVDDVRRLWERVKRAEKKRDSLLDGLPPDLPQLAQTARLSSRAAHVGYDFPDRVMLFDKLREEIDELARELFADGRLPDVPASVETDVVPDEPITEPDRALRVKQEIGDVLFVVANIARRWGVNPEEALRESNRKFRRRFQYIERALAESGRDIRDATLLEMERLYQQGKRKDESAATLRPQ
ncbi:MAG: nucleoside triphosphate pyrophosphohydrolase [Planctomycetes bacterium]|nr:nucleoside triphosphate pyrophosphohydrolase [Planctomycetota bacterium]